MNEAIDRVAEARAVKRFHLLRKRGLIEERQDELGVTQSDIARALGVEQSTVWRWASGDRRPRPSHPLALLEFLELLDD